MPSKYRLCTAGKGFGACLRGVAAQCCRSRADVDVGPQRSPPERASLGAETTCISRPKAQGRLALALALVVAARRRRGFSL